MVDMPEAVVVGKRSRRKTVIAAALVAAWLSWLALFICLAGHDSIWFDELFSIAQSRLPLPELLRKACSDIHPPLYPLMLKFFLYVFGDSWWNARLFSVVIVSLTAAIMIGAARDRRTGAGAAASFLMLPAVGFCTLDIRMYGLAMLFAAMFIVCVGRLIDGARRGPIWFCGLGVAAWGSAMTLNYAVPYLFVPAVWLTVSLWRSGRRRDCAVAVAVLAAAVVAYLPWLPYAWGQLTRVRADFWAPPLTLKSCILIFDMPFMGYSLNFLSTLILVAAVSALLIPALVAAFRSDRERFSRMLCLAATALLPGLLGVSWSLVRGQTLIIDRAMLPACVPLALMIGEAFAMPSRHRWSKVASAAVMALFFAYHCGCIVYRTRDGGLTRLRECLLKDYDGVILYYTEAHGAASAAGAVPERRHIVIHQEADPMGMLIIGNVDVEKQPTAQGGARVFILGSDSSPEAFRRSVSGVGELRVERSFYSRYRFQRFDICREVVTP